MANKTWLKYGCLGCVGLLVLLILIAAGVTGLAWRQAGKAEIERKEASHPVPALPGPGVAASPGDTAGTVTEDLDVGRVLEGAGRVIVDSSGGGFNVVPARPGEPLRIEATYDVNSYELEETFEEGGEEAWIYRVEFKQIRSGFLAGLGRLLTGTQPEVTLYLPPDVPLALELEITEGGGQVDLGGLWLTTADIEFARGGMELEVDTPLREPMEEMRIHGSMGGLAVSHLGNASPGKLDVDFSMGGMQLDLRGRWVQDSDISLKWDMGGLVVQLPRDAAVEGLDVEGRSPDTGGEVPLPTLTFTTNGDLNNLEIIH